MNMKMYKDGIKRVAYFVPPKIADDEEFVFADDSVVENIIPRRYLISNYGRVYDTFQDKFLDYYYSDKSIKHDGSPAGYPMCTFSCSLPNNNTDHKKVIISRAVAMTFDPIDNPEEYEVNHLDGDHSHNTMAPSDTNLEWSTSEDNVQHAKDNNLYGTQKDRRNRLTDEEVENACKLLSSGMQYSEVIEKTGLKYEILYDIKHKRTYRHITTNYQFPEYGPPETPDEVVIEAANRLQVGEAIEKLAVELDIPVNRMYRIRNKQYKPHLLESYDFEHRFDPEKETLIRNICEDLQLGIRPNEISRKYNVDDGFVRGILSGHGYKDISKDYNFPSFNMHMDNEKVRAICKELEKGEKSFAQIGRDFNINGSVVREIHNGDKYRNISKDYKFTPSTRLTEDHIIEICKKIQNGKSNIEISKEMDISVCTISRIRNRKSHSNITKDYNW